MHMLSHGSASSHYSKRGIDPHSIDILPARFHWGHLAWLCGLQVGALAVILQSCRGWGITVLRLVERGAMTNIAVKLWRCMNSKRCNCGGASSFQECNLGRRQCPVH